MSPPAEKARPAPVITSARSSDGGSCDSCATEACTASPISTVMAFRLSGRSSVNTLTPLCRSSTRTAVLSFCTCGTARRQAACSRGTSLDERISMAATPVALKQGNSLGVGSVWAGHCGGAALGALLAKLLSS